MVQDGSSKPTGDAARAAADKAKEAASGAADKAKDMADKAKGLGDKAPSPVDKAKGLGDKAKGAGDKANERMGNAAGAATGAAGKATGAAVGAAGLAKGVAGKAGSNVSGTAKTMSSTATSTTTTSTRKTTTTTWIDTDRDRRRKPAAMLAGLVLLGGIAGSTAWAVDKVEDRLVEETVSDLAAAGYDTSGLDIDFDFHDGEISGNIPNGLTEDIARTNVDDKLLGDLDVVGEPAPVATPVPTTVPEPTAAPEPTAVPAPVETGSTNVTVTKDAAGAIVLTGTVLTETQRSEAVAAAEAAVGADNVTDQLEVLDLGPTVDGDSERVSALASGVALFGGVDEATAVLTDNDLVITANTFDLSVSAQLASLDEADAAVPTTSNVTLLSPPALTIDEQVLALQSEIDSLSDEIRENVVFDTDSDVLTPVAQGTLDKVVAAMQTYPLPVVDVSGHTDSDGAVDYNVALSDLRATAVQNYLIERGIAAERLQARGAGPNEPVASNDTEEGKQQNRRVQFVALPGF